MKSQKNIPMYCVVGSYGITAAYMTKHRAEQEMKRIQKLGYSAGIYEAVLNFKTSKPINKKK